MMNLHKPLWISLWMMVTLALLVSPARGAKVKHNSLPCPVCGESVMVADIFSNNSLGGRDTDFLAHVMGANPVQMLVSTCTKCLYSGTRTDFEATTAVMLKDALLKTAPLVIPAGLQGEKLDAASLPVWAKWMLAAQSVKRRGASPRVVADRWLSAAWALRLDSGLILGSVPDLTRQEQELITATFQPSPGWEKKNRSLVDLETASRMLAELDSGTKEVRRPAAWLAVNILWKRGELDVILKNLERLAARLDPDGGRTGTFAVQLAKIAERIQDCQRQAREEFRANAEGTPEEQATYRYLVAELTRRLGEPATVELEKALTDPAAPKWFAMLKTDIEYIQGLFPGTTEVRH